MLPEQVEGLFDNASAPYAEEHFQVFQAFREALNSGSVRAAEPDPASKLGWRVNQWVKKGILLGFRMGTVIDMSIDTARQPFFDKSTFPVKRLTPASGVRIVPGGSSIRDGCYVGKGVTCMPPMFINVGAYVDDGTLIDSHALVGSCAQVGRKCHISAGAQIGGVLEPVGAMPVIIEDEVLVGGNSGVYEGTIVKRRAVLGTGTILNRSTPVYDVVTGTIHASTADEPLVIPENAVVVSGSRTISKGRGRDWQLSLYTPVIVKYRDAGTDTKVQLEDLLR
ncbi:MAG TPA: 2,3,4,5-tetrahydropyridine-2,6-dicarboxylate N-succinyltransferase [Candidatus Dormibacteraeota bacterium]|nr:2,3,4,5-tetrahydropyridine-2,6-dicarboxylate N-succinyltransferase [Candidatus Dormibacteraeota bacterium]